MEKEMDKAIITVVGKDTVGIIAKVCTYLAENDINILEFKKRSRECGGVKCLKK